MTVDPAVLVPLFASLGWPPRLRLVSRDWRYVYDKWCPRASKASWRVYHTKEQVYEAARDDSIPNWLGCRVQMASETTQGQVDGINDFNNVHTFTLFGSSGIHDVSPLIEVYNLDLSSCENIHDITPLALGRRMHTLNLGACHAIRDVSALGRMHTLHTLYLYYCTGIKDSIAGGVSALGNLVNLKHLSLSGCTGIRDVSALKNIPELSLCYCTGIDDAGILPLCSDGGGSVQTLNMFGCTGVSRDTTNALVFAIPTVYR